MIETNDSKAINVCRLLCVLFMTFVHVNPGPEVWGEHKNVLGYDLLVFFSNILGRASVPALSIISGFLIVNSLAKSSNYLSLVKSKFEKLIVPLVFWNLLMIIFSLLVFWAISSKTSQMRILTSEDITVFKALDLVTGIGYNSITEPLNFLRDIFVCALLSPLLVYLCRLNKLIFLFLTWTLCLNFDIKPIIMRDGILMFFAIGIVIGLNNEKVFCLSRSKILILLTAVLSLLSSSILSENLSYEQLTEYFFRLFVAFAFMVTSHFIAVNIKQDNAKKLGRYSFPLFLSHSIIFTFLWGSWQFLVGNEINNHYAFFYFLAPFLTLGIILLITTIRKFTPEKINSIIWGQ